MTKADMPKDYTAIFGIRRTDGYFAVTVPPKRFEEIWGMTIEEFAARHSAQSALADKEPLQCRPGHADQNFR